MLDNLLYVPLKTKVSEYKVSWATWLQRHPQTALFTKPRVSRLQGCTFHFVPICMRNPWSPRMWNHSAASTIPILHSPCAKNPQAFMPLSGVWRPVDFYQTFTLLAVFHMWSLLGTIMASSVEKLDFILQSTLDYSVSASNKNSSWQF